MKSSTLLLIAVALLWIAAYLFVRFVAPVLEEDRLCQDFDYVPYTH